MRIVLLVLLGLIGIGWIVSSRADDDEPATAPPGLPQSFIPVDTSRVMGSPDPWPLTAVRVFPRLTFDKPLEITHAGDGSGRLFVVEQVGVIKVFRQDEAVTTAEVFLDLREKVLRDGFEEGLLGLAFHPRFKQNGEFFVCYSAKPGADKPRATVISRFRLAKDHENQGDPKSEEVLLRLEKRYTDHNGGSLKFGPDKLLYIGLGDGGLRDDPHGQAQSLKSLHGKILRIDVDTRDEDLAYGIPNDNPFVGRKGARGEIWALGLRNVWRLAFDRKTGELWCGDVGQDRIEEVNRITRGGNYGWNFREGTHDHYPNTPSRSTKLIDPIVEYFHGEGQSVTGGVPYRGRALKEYDGAYFYGDWANGNVWIVRLDRKKQVKEQRQVARTHLSITAFGEDEAGEMLLLAFEGGVYRLQESPGDLQAIARAFPRRLSETGLFADVAENRVAPDVVPYDVNVPLWSDYAVKDRYIALPKAGAVQFAAQDKWEFPLGTVFVKTFWMHADRERLAEPRRLETRLLVNAAEGWTGYTYRYDDDGRDAELVDAEGDKETLEIKTKSGVISQPYYYPSRVDCLACHTRSEKFVLGLNTRQMNREIAFAGARENQLALWNRLGLFTVPLDGDPAKLEQYPQWGFGNCDRSGPKPAEPAAIRTKPQGTLDQQARAWLDVNCAMCHRPFSVAPGHGDLRYHTPLEQTHFWNAPPGERRRRVEGTMLIKPGSPEMSELLARTSLRGHRQMPPLGTHVVDPTADDILRRWIAAMQPVEN